MWRKAQNSGRCSAPRGRSNPARSMATSQRVAHGCSIRPRSLIRPSTFRMRRSVTASTGLPKPCRAARRGRPTITSQIVVWAIINALITLALMPFAPKRARRAGIFQQSVLIAVATVIVGYAALWLADLAFKIDFRFWIVALKLMSAKQFLIFLIYLVPIAAFFLVALHVLHRNFSTMATPRGALYATNILALTLGFIVLLALQYGTLFLSGELF